MNAAAISSLLVTSDYGSPVIYFYIPMIEQAIRQGDYREAVRLAEDALRFLPPAVTRLSRSRAVETTEEAGFSMAYVPIHEAYAVALRALGRTQEAQKQENRAAELNWAFQNWRRGG
jgi:tetratricopeptide (TPR) repeat protein